MQPVTLARNLAHRLRREARCNPAVEICGVIGERGKASRSVYPVANVASEPEQHFLMDAGEQIRAFKTMRERGESLFAIYHSHPDGTTAPSPADVAGLGYPEALYLIVAPDKTTANNTLRAWRFVDATFCEVGLTIVE